MARFAQTTNGQPVREPKVFICYRHLDSKAHVGRLRDRLHTTLGPEAAFLDKDDLLPGGEFPEQIAETIKTCDALLVVIGPDWLDEDNRRRLHEPDDFLRQEIAAALNSGDIKVMPVLVDGGEMPRADELPEDIRALTRRTAIKLSDDHWDYDTERLVEALRALVPREPSPTPERPARPSAFFPTVWFWKALTVAALVVAVVLFVLLVGVKNGSRRQTNVSRSQTLDECLKARAVALGIPPRRVKSLERGTSDYTVVEAEQPKNGRLLLSFQNSGRGLGAIVLNYSAANGVFKVEEVVGPDCKPNPRYGNEDHPGVKDVLRNWNRLLVRFREGGEVFRLRIGDHREGIRASFDVAQDPAFQP